MLLILPYFNPSKYPYISEMFGGCFELPVLIRYTLSANPLDYLLFQLVSYYFLCELVGCGFGYMKLSITQKSSSLKLFSKEVNQIHNSIRIVDDTNILLYKLPPYLNVHILKVPAKHLSPKSIQITFRFLL